MTTENKKQKIHILFIHGGMTFKNKRDYTHFLKTRNILLTRKVSWSGDYLDTTLGKKFEIIRPRMPLQDDAKYSDWKIHFERYVEHLSNKVILIGVSLGGIFLAKYLSENIFPKKLLGVHLVCAPFDDTLSSEDLTGGFTLKADLSLLDSQSNRLHLYFSKDDDVVPVAHAEKYRKKLPHADIRVFKSKNGHFLITRFPEIVKAIRNDVSWA